MATIEVSGIVDLSIKKTMIHFYNALDKKNINFSIVENRNTPTETVWEIFISGEHVTGSTSIADGKDIIVKGQILPFSNAIKAEKIIEKITTKNIFLTKIEDITLFIISEINTYLDRNIDFRNDISNLNFSTTDDCKKYLEIKYIVGVYANSFYYDVLLDNKIHDIILKFVSPRYLNDLINNLIQERISKLIDLKI